MSALRRGEIVLAHDYFTQRGGGERVALELARQLDADRILTAFYRPGETFAESADFNVELLHFAALRPFEADPRRALPILSAAWSSQTPIDAKTVVCSTSGWSHGLRVAEGTLKIAYCHNPARWLYQRDDYVRGMSLGVRAALTALTPGLRRWDRRAAHTADVYLANSTVVATRIRDIYGIEAQVLHPPMSIDIDGALEQVAGLDAGFFLTVARPRSYKGTELLKEAFARMPGIQLVVVGANLGEPVPANVTSLGEVSEAQLRWLYSHAHALVSISHEDFGLTPLEANAFGTPSLVLRSGGFLDSTAEGVSGLFIDSERIEDVTTAVRAFPDRWNQQAIVDHAALFSKEVFGERIRALAGIAEPVVVGSHQAAAA